MKKWSIGIAIVVVAVAIILVFIQTKKDLGEIQIGVILPLTGDGAAYGEKEKNGIELALSEINTTGGINGRNLKPIYEDSEGVPATATQAAQKLITQNKVNVIIGAAFSSPTLAMVPITDKNGIVLMSPTASTPKLSGSSEFFFRVWPSDLAEGDTIAKVAVKRMKLHTFAVLYGNNDYALGLKSVFIESIKNLGGEVVIVESYNDGDADFRTQLTKIKSLAPHAIYMSGYYKEFAKILIQAKELGVKAQFISCGTFPEPEILKIAGSAAEGVVFVQPYFDRNSKDPLIQKFVKDYESEFGIEAGIYAAHGYDAMKITAEAMKIGGYSADAIKKALLNLKDFPGVTGKTTFIEGGDVTKSFRIMTVLNGQFSDY